MNALPTAVENGKSTARASSSAAASRIRSPTSGVQRSDQATPTEMRRAGSRRDSGTSASSIALQSATVRAIGPAWSNVGASGKQPSGGTRPKLGLKPTIPQQAAGLPIDPPE